MSVSVKVTDHAVLRYLDRVGEYDVEEIRRDIALAVVEYERLYGGTGKFPVGDNRHMYVVSAGTVVSVVPK